MTKLGHSNLRVTDADMRLIRRVQAHLQSWTESDDRISYIGAVRAALKDYVERHNVEPFHDDEKLFRDVRDMMKLCYVQHYETPPDFTDELVMRNMMRFFLSAAQGLSYKPDEADSVRIAGIGETPVE